jgi:SWI/SNF-related matrix-associated actin-dependent regulator 1 of chromatin subfamily A
MSTIIKHASKITTSKGADVIKITFTFDWPTVNFIKTQIPDRKFNPKGKFWVAPITVEALTKLNEYGFLLDDTLQGILQQNKPNTKEIATKIPEIEVPYIHEKLYSYQQQGISFAAAKDGRCLIADEMGLGKTIQAIGYMQLNPGIRTVIVCPASLKLNWKREIETWLHKPGLIEVLEGKTAKPIHPEASIVIINYDILPDWVVTILNWVPSLMITDEAHYYKNSQAKRTKAVMKLGKHIDKVLALTGTPIENKPIELYNAIKLINPTIISSKFNFGKRYCAGHHDGFGWNFNGASNTDELHQLLTSTIMIRRLKKDVLKDLPDKQFSVIPMKMSNRTQYDEAEQDLVNFVKQQMEDNFRKDLRDKLGELADMVNVDEKQLEGLKNEKASKVNQLSRIEHLKQLAAAGKMKACVNWVEDFIENDQKIILFCTHKSIVNQLMERFGKIAVKIDGSVPTNKRQEVVDQFQNNPKIKIFVANIDAAGVGYTLTAASNVAFLEFPWTPGKLNQAIDRAHRISQKNTVNAYYLVAENTIDEDIITILDKKTKIINGIIDGNAHPDANVLNELLTKLKTK